MGILCACLFADLTVGVVTLGLLLYWYFTNNFDYWKKHNAPFLQPTPFFGNFKDRLLFRKSNCHVSQDLYHAMEGQPLFGTWFVKKPILYVRDPEIVKRILVKDFAHFHDRGLPVDEKNNPLSAHLFNLGGSRWRALRVKLTPTFTSGKMKMMYALMHECGREFVEFVGREVATSENGELEFRELLARFTTDIIGTCAFGLQFNSMKDPNSEFRTMGRKVFTPSFMGTLGMILVTMVPFMGKFFKIRFPKADVSDFFMKAVHDTVEYREKNNVRRNDFLQLLIDLKNKGKLEDEDKDSKSANGVSASDGIDIELTNNLLAAQAFVFFLAGFETSSTAMSFALHELSVNPKVLNKLQKEIDEVLKEYDGELTYEALRKMEYLENVINESLRKYPPVPVLMRVCNKKYTEPDTGAIVEEGVRVHIPVYAMQNDPKYFPNPENFEPDRFKEEEKAKRPHYVYLPFGEGPRICIGVRFGMLQAKLGLAALLSRFNISAGSRTPHPVKLQTNAFVTTCQGGVWIKVTPRKDWVKSTSESITQDGIITTEL